MKSVGGILLKEKSKKQNITISLPEIYCENLEYLKNEGLINNRSEGIRIAVMEFLEKELENIKLFGYNLEEDEVED